MESKQIKVLVVCSINFGRIAPFIQEQVEALQQVGVVTDYFLVSGKGFSGYLKNRKLLLQKIKEFQPDLIHAHYGLSGLLSNLQRKVPVVTTYHGSDINHNKSLPFSRLSVWLSKYNIFVSDKNRRRAHPFRHYALIPCGVNFDLFRPADKKAAREAMGYAANDKLVLFSNYFQWPVKNAALAQEAVALLDDVKLIELKGYSRAQVVMLMNAADVALMTSISEGSPQFIKEAMACNCPVVSVNVGDVMETISGTRHCSIVPYDAKVIAQTLETIIASGERTDGREKVKHLDNRMVAEKILSIYREVLKIK